jgi:putative copper resistance protein D
MIVDAVAVLIRGLSFIAMFQAAGGAIFATFFGDSLAICGTRVRWTLRIATVAAIALLVLQFAFEAARLAGDFSGLWDARLQALAWHSVMGSALRWRLLGLLLVLAGIQGYGPGGVMPWRRVAAPLCLGGTLALAVAFTRVGHTVDHPHRMLLASLLLVHLLSMGFWFGALWPLRQIVVFEAPATAAAVLERFSRIAVWIVPVLLLAGASLVLLLVPGWAVFGQPYGQLLLAKAAGFAALLGFAALNKLRLTPALGRNDPAAVPRLRRSLLGEYLVIGLVLAVTAIMTGLYSPDTV